MSFIDSSDLAQFAVMYQETFETPLDWYAASAADVHGERTYQNPRTVNALVLKSNRQLYDAQGQQHIVKDDIYLPLGTVVGLNDKLVPQGASPLVWAPILEVTTLPTEAEAVVVRVRTGATS